MTPSGWARPSYTTLPSRSMRASITSHLGGNHPTVVLAAAGVGVRLERQNAAKILHRPVIVGGTKHPIQIGQLTEDVPGYAPR